jgi:hypothetical protein
MCKGVKELQSWKSLKYLLINYKTNHYKTIQYEYLEWSRLNIILQKYKLDSSNIYDKNNYLDSSNIYDKNSYMNTGYGMNQKKERI